MRKENMYQKNKTILRKKLQMICLGNSIVKIIYIPVSLYIARLLSNIVSYATSGNMYKVIYSSLYLLFWAFFLLVLQMVAGIILQKEEMKMIHSSEINFLEMLQENSLDKLFRIDYGEIIENISKDMELMVKRYIELYPKLFSNLLGIVCYLLYFMYQNSVIAIALISISLLQLFPPLIVKKYMQINYEQCEKIEALITNHIVEMVNGIETIKLYNLKHWWNQKLFAIYKEYLSVGRKTDAVAALQRSMYRLLDNFLKFGTYALIGFFVICQFCSMNVAVEALYLSGDFFQGVKELFSVIPEDAVARKARERIEKWLPCKVDTQELNHECKEKSLKLENITYYYGNRKIFNNIKYQFDNNKNYLIIGENGVGKTTLFNLIMGFLIPNTGTVIGATHKNREIFYIPQDDILFHHNIAALIEMFGEPPKKNIHQILNDFGMSNYLNRKQQICDFSGGERKKIYLAIGFAMNSKWLFLDEPSNNLDKEGKKVLLEYIRKRKGIIMISHDPLLYESVDVILKIENGRICNENSSKIS